MRILNFGAGVQSTAIYLLMMEGRIPRADHAIFADTGEEPQAVYDHLEWIKKQDGPPLTVVSCGTKLGDCLVNGMHSTGQRFVSIPAFHIAPDGKDGMGRRQCSEEFKIKPIRKWVRQLLGLKPKTRVPAGTVVHQVYGISLDEAGRAVRIRANSDKWQVPEFPLLDLQWSRRECQKYLATRVPHEVWKSACTFCPYHHNAEWRKIRGNDKAGWKRALEIDAALRGDAICNRKMEATMYLHAERKPLAECDIEQDDPAQHLMGFVNECMGVCGV